MRKALLVVLALLLCFVFPAAAKRSPETKPATITMQHWGAPEQTVLHEAQAELFNKDFPQITVKIEAVPVNEYFVKLISDVAAGTAADVLMNNASAQVDTLTKIFIPLDQYMRDRTYGLSKRDYVDSLWFYCEKDRTTYTVPLSFVVRSIFYNTALFDKYSVPYPDNDWTWPEFVETCKALNRDADRDGLADTIGFDISISGAAEWYMWLFSAGGDIVDLDKKEGVFNSQAGYDAMQLYIDAARGFEIGPSPLGLATGVGYISGQAAMIVSMPLARVLLPTMGLPNFGIARMPKHPDHPRANMAAGETLGISPSSRYPWESWLWVRSMMQYDQQKMWADLGWGFPSHKELLGDMDMTDPMNEAFWLDSQNNWYAKMWYHRANDVDSLVGQMIQEVMLKHKEKGFDLQAVLDRYAAEATAILQEEED